MAQERLGVTQVATLAGQEFDQRPRKPMSATKGAMIVVAIVGLVLIMAGIASTAIAGRYFMANINAPPSFMLHHPVAQGDVVELRNHQLIVGDVIVAPDEVFPAYPSWHFWLSMGLGLPGFCLLLLAMAVLSTSHDNREERRRKHISTALQLWIDSGFEKIPLAEGGLRRERPGE